MSTFSVDTAESSLGRHDAPFKFGPRKAGGWVKFPSGWTVSIQWNPGNYCDNYDCRQFDSTRDSTTAEIAVWKTRGDLHEWEDGDTVQGYLSWDEVQRVLDLCERGEILNADGRASREPR